MGIDKVQWFQIDTRDPVVEKPIASNQKENQAPDISYERNKANADNTVVSTDPIFASISCGTPVGTAYSGQFAGIWSGVVFTESNEVPTTELLHYQARFPM